MSSHTPTPYKVAECYHEHERATCKCVQIGTDTLYTTSALKAEDAEFIVRACNNHDTLLYACQLTLHRLKNIGMADGIVADGLRAVIAKAQGDK